MSANRQLILGLFFVVVFGVLGWFTLFKSDFSLFRESYPMVVHFNQAGGLKAGDSVRVAGMKWGQVNSMTFDPAADDDRRVTVELLLDRELTLYTDAVIEIQEASVLGGKVLAIEPGQSNLGPMPSDEPLYGEVQQNVMESLSNLVQENRDSLASILENLERTIVDLREGNGALTRLLYSEDLADDLAAAVSSISGTFENAEALTEQLRSEDRGTLGKLIYEDFWQGHNPLLYVALQPAILPDDAVTSFHLTRFLHLLMFAGAIALAAASAWRLAGRTNSTRRVR